MHLGRPISTFQAYFQQLVKGVRNPQSLLSGTNTAAKSAENPANILQQLRNLDRAQVASGAVITAELLGFFTVGEIIGRMKLVGYQGDTGAHH
jgi:F-type H+-transporting ATPase subunit g